MIFDAEFRDKYADKLAEAEYFLARMCDTAQQGDPWPFTYNMRAFVSAARSVEDYVQRAAKAAGQSSAFFLRHDKEPVLDFFRSLRNVNLHEAPAHATHQTSLSVGVGGVVVVRGRVPESSADAVQTPAPTDVTVTCDDAGGSSSLVRSYTFDRWSGAGSSDVFYLCERYLIELRRLLDDATAAAWISR